MKRIEIHSVLVIITEPYFFVVFLHGIVLSYIQDHKHVANTGLCNLELVLERYSSFNHQDVPTCIIID